MRAKVDLLTTLGRHQEALAVVEPEIGKPELNLGLFDRWCELMRQLERAPELASAWKHGLPLPARAGTVVRPGPRPGT